MELISLSARPGSLVIRGVPSIPSVVRVILTMLFLTGILVGIRLS